MASQYSSREAEPAQKSQNMQRFTPVNIGMLSNPSFQASIDSSRETLCIVCRVEKYDDSGANTNLTLRDETGVIEGRIYKSQSKSTVHAVQDYQFKPNGYASVLGNPRLGNYEPCIVVNRIKNVDSCKEVNLHRAQIIWALLVKNSVLKVPQAKTASQFKTEEEETAVVNTEGLSPNQFKVKKTVADLCKKSGRAKKDDILRSVKLIPKHIEEALRELVSNGILIEEDNYQYFTLV